MKSVSTALLVALLGSQFSVPTVAAVATPSSAENLSCTIGPLNKTYGKTQWLVYGCNDGRSLVVTTAPENPAAPFVFYFYWGSKGMSLYIAKGRFELTETLSGTTDLADAQKMLMPTAVTLCGSQSLQFGNYRFNSTAPMANKVDGGSTLITLVQDVECGGTPNQSNAQDVAQTQAPLKASPADEASVRARTLEYLSAKDRGDFDTAHAMFGVTMQAMMTQDAWRTPRATFNAAAGLPRQREVVRITWYDNPPGASPGRYAAADYRASYPNAAFYCGYVAWLQQPDESYRIVREEEGLLTPREAGKIAPGQMAATRLQLGCRD